MEQRIEMAYEVHKLPGEVKVERCKIEKRDAGNGKTRNVIVREQLKADAGYMVHFPNGNSIRVATKEKLAEMGFDVPAPFIDMESGKVLGAPRSLKK